MFVHIDIKLEQVDMQLMQYTVDVNAVFIIREAYKQHTPHHSGKPLRKCNAKLATMGSKEIISWDLKCPVQYFDACFSIFRRLPSSRSM